MLRAVTLLSKAFLHHLTTLLTLPNFSVLWLRALELLQVCISHRTFLCDLP